MSFHRQPGYTRDAATSPSRVYRTEAPIHGARSTTTRAPSAPQAPGHQAQSHGQSEGLVLPPVQGYQSQNESSVLPPIRGNTSTGRRPQLSPGMVQCTECFWIFPITSPMDRTQTSYPRTTPCRNPQCRQPVKVFESSDASARQQISAQLPVDPRNSHLKQLPNISDKVHCIRCYNEVTFYPPESSRGQTYPLRMTCPHCNANVEITREQADMARHSKGMRRNA